MVLVFLYDTFNLLDEKYPTGHLFYIFFTWQFEKKLFSQVYNSHTYFPGTEAHNICKKILYF